jgi:hypothetical protein
LQKIIAFGRHLHVKYIELADESMVDSNTCKSSVALAPFDILTTGSSWYNKQGFKSEDHDNDTTQNTIISNNLFDDTIPIEITTKFKKEFSDITTTRKTIKDVLLELKKRYLKREYTESLNHQQCETIKDLTMHLYETIHYNNTLKLFLGGKKTKQNKTKQNKTKQNKTKQNKTKQNKTKQNKNKIK